MCFSFVFFSLDPRFCLHCDRCFFASPQLPTNAKKPIPWVFLVFPPLFGGHQSLLWRHWYLCSGLLVTSVQGFKARVDPLLACLIAYIQIHLWILWNIKNSTFSCATVSFAALKSDCTFSFCFSAMSRRLWRARHYNIENTALTSGNYRFISKRLFQYTVIIVSCLWAFKAHSHGAATSICLDASNGFYGNKWFCSHWHLHQWLLLWQRPQWWCNFHAVADALCEWTFTVLHIYFFLS